MGFTEADVRLAAGARSFERGLGYLDDVGDLEIAGAEITASVWGTEKYRVRVRSADGGLSGDCTCPHGQDGFFCKHCVAVGLAVLRLDEDGVAEARADWQTLESWLGSLSRDGLLAEVLGLLDGDRELRRRLELRAATVNGDAETVGRLVIDLVTAPPGDFIASGQAHEYAGDAHKAAAAIDDLIRSGGAEDAIGIAEEAIDELAGAFGSADDSSGSIRDAGYTLLDVHLRACQAAPPDPGHLGRYLADLLLGNDQIWPDLGDYADLLGEAGFAAVRERVAAAYEADPESSRAASLMEAAAEAEGDVDAIITLYAANLDDRGWNHLRIAEALDEAGRGADALGWAERGVREAARPDERLVDYLSDRYAAEGRPDDALGLRRARFNAQRTLASYQALRQAAMKSGVWPAEREQALARLREDARAPGSRWDGPVLVDALTDDGDLDAAWAAAAACATEAQWLRLADASAAGRPADALAVYLRAIAGLKKQTGDKAYRRMAALLLSARGCHEALGTTDQFRRYLALLRAECKRKTNLMRILDASGL